MHRLTMNDYSDMALAMHEKNCDEQNNLRIIQTAIINFGGMGAKKIYTPQQVMPIPLIDSANIILPIRTVDEAIKLLKEFETAITNLHGKV